MLLTLNVHISRLDDVGCKHLTSGNVRIKIVHLYPCILILYNVRIEIIFPYRWIMADLHVLSGRSSNINALRLSRRALIFRDLPSNNMC